MQKGFPRTPGVIGNSYMPPPSRVYQGQYPEDEHLTASRPQEPAMRSGFRIKTPPPAPERS